MLRRKSLHAYRLLPIAALLLLAAILITAACSLNHVRPVVIWSDRSELASYAELFNASQNGARVVVVYKDAPARALNKVDRADAPDIVLSPWLNNSRLRDNFMPIDYLFTDRLLSQADFYPKLLEAGRNNSRQYLLPVSFNLPAVIFTAEHGSLVPQDYALTLTQLKETGGAYNEQRENGMYTRMGFAPRWNERFLALAARFEGANFHDDRGTVVWNQQELTQTVDMLKSWTAEKNTSSTDEEDFAFKYLYTPSYKGAARERALYSYTASDEFFSLSEEDAEDTDFRWLCFRDAEEDEALHIPVNDEAVFMGIYKGSTNMEAAEVFITWFMKAASQELMLKRNLSMNLENPGFGIAGGFSALREVSEQIFPSYYPRLLGSLPPAESIEAPLPLPAQWDEFCESVLYPYLTSATDTDRSRPSYSIEQLVTQWEGEY